MAESRTADLEAQLLQGARGVQNNTENMLERLSKMFKGTELVTIKNPFDIPFGWVYTDPGETTVEQPDTVTRRVNFGAPKARTLEPGEKRTIPGWEAYIAIERMWKAYAQTDPTQVAIVLTSRLEMDAFLENVYLGVFDPNNANTPSDALGFENKQPEPVPVTTAQPAVPTAPIEHPPVVSPTSDENLGFDDDDNDGNDENTTIPPMQDQSQQNQQLPPELQ